MRRRSSSSSTSYTRFSNARTGRQRPVQRRPPISTASSTRSGVSEKKVAVTVPPYRVFLHRVLLAGMLSWIEIDTRAVRRNIDAFRSIVPSGTALMVVVKANAYGHGLDVIAPVAAEHAEWLGVNALDEALAIRALGI